MYVHSDQYRPQRDAPRRRYPGGPVVSLTISMPKAMRDIIVANALDQGKSISGFIVDMLVSALDEQP